MYTRPVLRCLSRIPHRCINSRSSLGHKESLEILVAIKPLRIVQPIFMNLQECSHLSPTSTCLKVPHLPSWKTPTNTFSITQMTKNTKHKMNQWVVVHVAVTWAWTSDTSINRLLLGREESCNNKLNRRPMKAKMGSSSHSINRNNNRRYQLRKYFISLLKGRTQPMGLRNLDQLGFYLRLKESSPQSKRPHKRKLRIKEQIVIQKVKHHVPLHIGFIIKSKPSIILTSRVISKYKKITRAVWWLRSTRSKSPCLTP